MFVVNLSVNVGTQLDTGCGQSLTGRGFVLVNRSAAWVDLHPPLSARMTPANASVQYVRHCMSLSLSARACRDLNHPAKTGHGPDAGLPRSPRLSPQPRSRFVCDKLSSTKE